MSGNGYEKRAKYIPGNWFDAIDAFWRASILKEYFGKPFVDTYCTIKEVEADRFYAEPTRARLRMVSQGGLTRTGAAQAELPLSFFVIDITRSI